MGINKSSLAVKFVMTFIVAAIAPLFMERSGWSWVLGIAVVVTAVNYLVGDLVILPSYGNIVAAVGDGLLAGVTADFSSQPI